LTPVFSAYCWHHSPTKFARQQNEINTTELDKVIDTIIQLEWGGDFIQFSVPYICFWLWTTYWFLKQGTSGLWSKGWSPMNY